MDYPIKTLNQLHPILQGFRKKAGLTQTDIATQLGITQQSYARIEADPASTSVERLYKVMRLLNVVLIMADQPEEDLQNVVARRSVAVKQNSDSKASTSQDRAKANVAQKIKPAPLNSATRPAPKKILIKAAKKVLW
jgi:HTH-type transcriptional regulator/antitoxin HipB